MRSAPTNRKEYKTEETVDSRKFPYLYWKKFPVKADLLKLKNVIEVRIWLAGTSSSEKWYITHKHEVGSKKIPEGGYTVKDSKGEVCNIWFNEAIVHPTILKKL